MRLCTASWRTLWEASKAGSLAVQPVRISRGVPKFWPAASVFPAVEELMPDGWMFGITDSEKFARCYRRKLHMIGLPRIRARLEEIAIASGAGKAIVLCCFESDCADCHRGPHGFAQWWARQTGQSVVDLAILRSRETGALALVCEAPYTQPTGRKLWAGLGPQSSR